MENRKWVHRYRKMFPNTMMLVISENEQHHQDVDTEKDVINFIQGELDRVYRKGIRDSKNNKIDFEKLKVKTEIWDYKERLENAKKLADNLQQYSGNRNCPICGIGPEDTIKYINKIIKSELQREREKTLKEVREIIEITKQNYAYNSHGGRALKELPSKINKLK